MENSDLAGIRSEKLRIGISTCLLGESVRYDGGHKRDRFLTDTLGRYVQWVPVCPEVECGLPTPREPMQLEGDPVSPRLMTIRTHVDHTDRMQRWAKKRLRELEREGLCGFIFKTKSPSSGMRGIRVYDEKGAPHKVGVGIFARAFMDRFPLLPAEDEGHLHGPEIRENFIERVFALRRYRAFLASHVTVSRLAEFHTRHKLQLMAHSQRHLRQMGRLLARPEALSRKQELARYEALLLEALRLRATVKKNANVLLHMLRLFKAQLSADEKQELLEVIAQYKAELTPLVVPVTLFRHYVRKYDEPYLARQTYLNPHPTELKLRNHV